MHKNNTIISGIYQKTNLAGIAKILGISPSAVSARIDRGMPFLKRGGRGHSWEFCVADVLNWHNITPPTANEISPPYKKHWIVGRNVLAAHLGVKVSIVNRWIVKGMPLVQHGDDEEKRYIFNMPEIFRWLLRVMIAPRDHGWYQLSGHRFIKCKCAASITEAHGRLFPHISDTELQEMEEIIAIATADAIPSLAFESLRRTSDLELQVRISMSFDNFVGFGKW